MDQAIFLDTARTSIKTCVQKKIESLQDAAKVGDLEAAKKLLDGGADVNGKDAKGITPLGVAVGFNKVSIIKLFLEKEADVEQTDPRGNTALHYAAGKLCRCDSHETMDEHLLIQNSFDHCLSNKIVASFAEGDCTGADFCSICQAKIDVCVKSSAACNIQKGCTVAENSSA